MAATNAKPELLQAAKLLLQQIGVSPTDLRCPVARRNAMWRAGIEVEPGPSR